MTTYKKLSDNEYQITDTKEEISLVKLDFIEADILHKDKLIADLQAGITKLQTEKAELVILKNALLKAK